MTFTNGSGDLPYTDAAYEAATPVGQLRTVTAVSSIEDGFSKNNHAYADTLYPGFATSVPGGVETPQFGFISDGEYDRILLPSQPRIEYVIANALYYSHRGVHANPDGCFVYPTHEITFGRPITGGYEYSVTYTDEARLAEDDWGDTFAGDANWAYLLEQAALAGPQTAPFGGGPSCGPDNVTPNPPDFPPFWGWSYAVAGTEIDFPSGGGGAITTLPEAPPQPPGPDPPTLFEPKSKLQTIADNMADVLSGIDIVNLQVVPYRWFAATPPALDIYPADPAQEDEAFGPAQSLIMWIVRARVGTVDNEGQQALLLSMMEPYGPTSVRAALNESDELGGTVQAIYCERPSGYRLYDEIGAVSSPLMGVEWRVRVHNESES